MTKISHRSRMFVGAAALAAGSFCLTVVAIPIAEVHGVTMASWLRFVLGPICHQISDRCLDLGSGPLAVCARCTGLYVGGFLGLIATAVGGHRFRSPWKIVALAAAPSIIDFGLGQLGLSSLTNWPRFSLATVPGLLLGFLLADAISTITPGHTESPGGLIT